MGEKYFAGGFLFHRQSGSVLLQWRGSRTSVRPNTWCFLGGWSEAEDGGRAEATWRREMGEELGIDLDSAHIVPLCDYTPASNPYHRYIFYCEWPSLAEDFSFPEDEEDLAAVRWFTVQKALALPHLLSDGTRHDLALFQERLRTA
ncbi:MAG TPA: NUDIX hydrolase [Chloroflexota bacterium]|nr:NUDIX hydrolase [Chloroflexota bacterium]